MDEMLKDARFAHIAKDPKFRRIPKAERKVKIDHRFKDMFKDKKFTVKYTIDKRGRPINQTTTENLRKYYDLSSSEDEDASVSSTSKKDEDASVSSTSKKDDKKKEIKENTIKKAKDKKKLESKAKSSSVKDPSDEESKDDQSDDNCASSNGDLLQMEPKETCSDDESNNESLDNENEFLQKGFSQLDFDQNEKQLHTRRGNESGRLTSEIKERLKDLSVNYARGEGVLLTDSSSEEELSEASGNILFYCLSNIIYCTRIIINLYFALNLF